MFGLFQGSSRPRGLEWRSSVWFITLVVGYGIMTDLMVYSVIIPVVPFQLEKLGYTSPSALTGWLLFAYARSAALVASSPVCSWFSEKYCTRRTPMLWGLLSLMGFLVLFMEAPNYPVMVVARFIQGISSSVVWIIGLALVVDTVPEEKVGLQLGLATTGLAIGLLAAPPIGGILYDRLGFRAPFIFGIIVTAIDFLGRLLVIERKDAIRWGYDPTLSLQTNAADERPNDCHAHVTESEETRKAKPKNNEGREKDDVNPPDNSAIPQKLSEYKVWKFMLTSRRTIVALSSILIYGMVYTGLEPTLALRLQDVYGFNSTKVGLVILASVAAAVFAAPISGWISDRFGMEWITVACLMLTIPWYTVLMIKGHLAFFVVCFAIANVTMSALVSPLTAELSSVVRRVDGIGFAHVYGFFNMAYGTGSAVGPIVAGQVYSHVKNGWIILLAYGAVMLFLCGLGNLFFGGERPIVSRFRCRNIVSDVP